MKPTDDTARSSACKFCLKGGLEWVRTGKTWSLADSKTGELHHCRMTGPRSANGRTGMSDLTWTCPPNPKRFVSKAKRHI